MPIKSIHVVVNGKVSFFFMAGVCVCVCVCVCVPVFFILSSVDEYLGYFHILATVNNAAVNMEIHISF